MNRRTVDYRQLHAEEDDVADLVIGWLKEHPNPLTRHRSAYSWNWDWGHRVLGWIVSQPTCDRATAIHIFWAALPHEVVAPEYAEEFIRDKGSVYYLLRLIAELEADGRFPDENLETQWSEQWQAAYERFDELLASGQIDESWQVARQLKPRRPIFEWVSHPFFPEGIPQPILDQISDGRR